MSDKQPEQKPLEFDEIELHTDQPITRSEPPVKRERTKQTKSSGGVPVWLLILILLAGAGGTYYFFDKHEKLNAVYQSLVEEEQNIRANLSQSANTLEGAQEKIVALTRDLQSSGEENTELRREIDARKRQLSQTRQDLNKANDEITGLNGRIEGLQGDVAKVSGERDQRTTELNELREQTTGQIADLEQRMAQNQTDYDRRIAQMQSEKAAQDKLLQTARRDRDDAKRRLEEESAASLQIISQNNQLRKENENLKAQVDELNSLPEPSPTPTNDIQTGDLAPFSDEITPGVVTYKEPLSVEIPRRYGRVAVQALITDAGGVEKAFILPGQSLEGPVAAGIIQSVLQWKFQPPTYRGVRVKTWQTVLIEAE